MRPPADSSCLANVQLVPAEDAGRVLTLGWKLLLNASLLLVPVLLVGLFAPFFVLAAMLGSSQSLLVASVAIPVIFVAQIAWAGTYPEWPMNRLLVRRLRRSCRSRQRGRPQDWIQTARMVEWVPRENWSATRLDTAEDVMLIRVDETGVQMEGDFSRYSFPAASIIDVEVESVRPTGCFHSLHFVVVTVRSEKGPMEFPLAYRDHQLGRLRSRHRSQQTHELCHDIRGIARGGDSSYRDPDYDRIMHFDPSHAGVGVPAGPITQDDPARANPYAAPRSV